MFSILLVTPRLNLQQTTKMISYINHLENYYFGFLDTHLQHFGDHQM